jgi:hypothetical protein
VKLLTNRLIATAGPIGALVRAVAGMATARVAAIAKAMLHWVDPGFGIDRTRSKQPATISD